MPFIRTAFGRAFSLRMRLTVTYLILVTLLLLVVGWFFGQLLRSILYQRSDALLEQQWNTVRGFMDIRDGQVIWSHRAEHPETEEIIDKLRGLIHIADDSGKTLEVSEGYKALGVESPQEIAELMSRAAPRFRNKRGATGENSRVRQGVFVENGRRYFVSIGYSNAENNAIRSLFVKIYFTILPILLLLMGWLSWLAASSALQPVNDLVRAVEAISARNLNVRLKPTRTGDELDVLIQNFNRMLERLDENFTQIRQFSIDASHELRTPLTGIRGQLEVALMSANHVEQYREAIVTALQDVERLTRIVQSLLLLTQAESGQLVLQRRQLDLSASVRDMVNQFELSTNDKGIALVRQITSGCQAYVDPVQFDRLVSNLLSNAVRFSEPGGQVVVSLAHVDSSVHFSVADTGPGIPAEHLPNIFERFYRVPGAHEENDQGLGLGLCFVKWVVNAHGGTITVASELGKGTTFDIIIPSAPDRVDRS